MRKKPRVSCIMPVYNCEKYLSAAIESVLNQSFEDFELIIINDNSNDNSERIIKKYQDERIIYIKNKENLGIVYSLNKGWKIAKGEYIARMDGDDICYRERFKCQVDFLDNNRDIGLISCWFLMIGDQSGVIKYDTDPEVVKCKLLFSLQLLHPGWMFRKKEFDDLGLQYEEDYKYAEDYALLAKASSYIKMTNLNQVLMKYRISNFQTSSVKKDIQKEISAAIKILLFKNLGYNLNATELGVFQKYGNQQKNCDVNQLKILDEIFCEIVQKNHRKNLYDEVILIKVLEEAFYNLCYYNILNGNISGAFYLQSGIRKLSRKRNLLKMYIRIITIQIRKCHG